MNMLGFRCKHKKCNAKVRVPDMDESLKSEIAGIAREKSVLFAIEKLDLLTKFDYRDSKA